MKALRLFLIILVLLLFGLLPMSALGQVPPSESVRADTSAAQEIPAGIWTTLNTVMRIGPFVVDPRNASVMYAGAKTGNSGGSDAIWKSTDGGSTWSATSLKVFDFGYFAPILDPNDSNVTYAIKDLGIGSDEGGIWKSTDGGQTWNQSMTTGYTSGATSMVIDPTNSNVLYAGVESNFTPEFQQHPYGYGSLFKSYDGGVTWAPMGSYTADGRTAGYADITTIAIDPHNPQVLYAGTKWGQVLKSTNGGSSWNGYTLYTDVSTPIYSLRVDVNNLNIIYGVGRGYIKSIDGGLTVTHINNGIKITGGGLGGLIIDPLDSNTLYGSNTLGPIRSTDAGANWSVFANGLSASTADTPFLTPRFDGSGCKLYTSQNDRNVRAFYAYRFPANISLSSTSQSFSSDANSGSITVTLLEGRCSNWMAKSSASWITITSGASGSGNGLVGFSLAGNTSNSSRTGTITIEDKTFTITQAGVPPCSYALSSSSQSFAAAGGNSSVGVTSAANCVWTVTNVPSWITSSGGSSGTGTVVFAAATNTGNSLRTAIMTIAGQPFTVTQDAALPVAAATTVQFSASSYNVNEGANGATITVTRSGNTSGITTVDYVSSDSSARQRSDYTFASGTLRFASGEVGKTFTVLVTDNAYVDGNRTVNLILSKTVGASLGFPSSAVLTINDNDTTPPTTSPLNDPAFFVRLHYYDFLNRYPDQGGWDFWTNEITSCGTNQQCIDVKRINVSAAYFLSIEFQQTGYLVERIYKAAYGSANGTSTFGGTHQLSVPIVRLNEFLPDTQAIGNGVIVGQAGWEQALENNKQAFTNEFVQRSRFTTAYPASMTPAQFVDTLNANAGNPLSTAERNQLVSDLSTNAKTRAQALRTVAEDPDLNNAEFNRAFVLMQFFGYLRRNPNDPQDTDYTGYDFWLTKLNQFNGDFVNAEMVKAFISSGEYRNRFGP